MRTEEEIRAKLKEVGEVRHSVETACGSVEIGAFLANPLIAVLKWVLNDDE